MFWERAAQRIPQSMVAAKKGRGAARSPAKAIESESIEHIHHSVGEGDL